MSLESLLQQVPPDAIYRRVPLAEDENALGPWRAAVERLVRPDDVEGLWEELIYGGEDEDHTAPPARINVSAVRQLLEINRGVLPLLSEGTRRARLQFPEIFDLDRLPEDSEFACRLAELAELPLVRSRVFQADGDPAGAAEDAMEMLRMGRMISRGEGQVLHYLIGLWIRSAALRVIRRLAVAADTPLTAIDSLLTAVEQGMSGADGLPLSLQVDFCGLSLPQLDLMPDDGDIETLVCRLLAHYYVHGQSGSGSCVDDREVLHINDWQERRRQQVLRLLDAHPHPFDKAATARLMGEIIADSVRELQSLPPPELAGTAAPARQSRQGMAQHRLAQQTMAWPIQLTPGFHGRSPDHGPAGWLALAQDTDFPEEPTSDFELPTDAQLAAACLELRGVDNPIGLVLAQYLLPFDYSPFMFQHRDKMIKTRQMLAERLGES